MNDIAVANYPEVSWTVDEPVFMGCEDNTVLVVVMLEREVDDDFENQVPLVCALRFPQTRSEGWWVLIGETNSNTLFTIRHILLNKRER